MSLKDKVLTTIRRGVTLVAVGTALTLAAPTDNEYVSMPSAYAKADTRECTPHYLSGIRSPKDPLENMLEKDRVYRSTIYKYPEEPTVTVINGSMETEREIHGVKVKLIFPNYIKTEKGVTHYHAAGIDTYTQKEFECMVEDNARYVKTAAELAMQDYEKTLEVVLAAQEKELKKSGKLGEKEKLKDLLDKDVPGYPGLKVRDVLFTPDIKTKDFVPTKYYFGEIAALGVTYINSGIIDIDPKARMLDHINGWPAILIHEMTHRNPKLQSYPLLSKFDPEIWASFPMLAHDDMDRLLKHSYLKDLRKISRILFNFDSQLAYADMMSLDLMMGREIEKENGYRKVKDYMAKVATISQAVRDVAFNQYIPEFYTHPLYYMTLNEFLKDDNATFKIIMYKNFEPTLLGGPNKTRDFLEEHSDMIRGAASSAMREMKSERTKTLTEEELSKIKSELAGRLSSMTPAQRKTLLSTAEMLGMPRTEDTQQLVNFALRLHRLGIVDLQYDEEEVLSR